MRHLEKFQIFSNDQWSPGNIELFWAYCLIVLLLPSLCGGICLVNMAYVVTSNRPVYGHARRLLTTFLSAVRLLGTRRRRLLHTCQKR